MRALTVALLLALSLSPALVRADAIGPPPSCPAHSEPDFCHGPPTCAPRECLSSRDCEGSEHCAVVDLCTEEHACGGGWGSSDERTHVLGLCGPGDTCVEGTCSGQFVCVPGGGEDASVARDASRADASGTDAGDGRTHVRYGACDCQCAAFAGRSRGPAPWLSFPLGLALFGWASRRRK